MTSTPESPRRRRRWGRRLALVLLCGLTGLIALILALPWIIEVPWVQRQLAAQASRVLAPGAVRFEHVSVSWNRPITILGLVLKDAQGDEIVVSPRATLDWNLRQLVLTQPKTATLTLDKASVDIERSSEGKIDLLETLKPVLSDEPKVTLLVRVVEGKLRFRDEGLGQPFEADKANIDLDLNAYPQPISWRMDLERTTPGPKPGRVNLTGSMSRKRTQTGAPEELSLALKADRWPWEYKTAELAAQGALDGTIEVAQNTGQISLAGDVKVIDLKATGSRLAGDQVQLEAVAAAWKVSRQNDIWKADRLEVTSGLGVVKGSGSYPPRDDAGLRLEGSLDLAALARQIPRTLHIREDLHVDKGSVRLEAEVTGEAAKTGQVINVTAKLSELSARKGNQTLSFRDPATLIARLSRGSDSFSLEQLEIQTPFLTATGRGNLDRGIDVRASVDLDAATGRLKDWVELGRIELAGKGTIDAHYQRAADRFEATAKADFKGLKISGLPAVEMLSRDQLASSLQAKGAAEPSGLPSSLHELLWSAKGDAEDMMLSLNRDQATGLGAGSFKGQTRLVVNGKKQDASATLQGRLNDQELALDSIILSLAPVVGPGGQFLPSAPARWSGKGKYDLGKDELTIAGDPVTAADSTSTSLPIAPTLIRAGGLKTIDRAWFEVTLTGELAELNPSTKTNPMPLTGPLSAMVKGRRTPDGWDAAIDLRIRDLARGDASGVRQVLAEQVEARVKAKVAPKLDRLEFSEIAVVTPYGRVDGSGPVTDLRGSPQFDLAGTLDPDWKVLSSLLASKIEPNASISGGPRAWRLSGMVPSGAGPDPLAKLSGELGLNLEQVDVFGMRLGRTALVVRAKEGKFSIDPIDSTLNSGRLRLEPELTQDKQGGRWLHLGPSSGLLDAVVNEEVSSRVLRFAAPVLDQATRVRGRVSLALNEAFIPLAAPPEAQARIDGDVLFDALEFMPGPLADQIIGVFRQERRPLLVLRDPVSIRILGRKIYQEGLIIPLGNIAAIGIEGWVDFDQNLDLVASFAMAPPRRNIPVLSEILANTQIQVPITGTFKKPRLNGDAIGERFKNMGVNMLDNLIGIGGGGLGRIIRGRPGQAGNPPDLFPPFIPPGLDDAPPPPQPGSQKLPEVRTPVPADPKPGGQTGTARQPTPPPKPGEDNPDDDLAKPPARSGQLTPEQKEQMREDRRLRRLEKRAERRLRRGLPPQ